MKPRKGNFYKSLKDTGLLKCKAFELDSNGDVALHFRDC